MKPFAKPQTGRTGRTSRTSPTSPTHPPAPTEDQKAAFKAAVHAWAARLKVQPAQIRIQKMRTKWASCSPGKWISFSESLLCEREEFRRYAIVHELLHLRIPNHGKVFKSLMSIYVPDWRQWEKRHG